MLSESQLRTWAQRLLRHGRGRVVLAVFVVVAFAGACREPFRALGTNEPAAVARARGAEVFGAFAARMTDPLRDAKYDSARAKIANAAFLPSRVWEDTSVWVASGPHHRTLLVSGSFIAGRYRFDAAPSVASPTHVSESRHSINLTRLSGDSYAWDTEVDYAIGSVSAADVGAFLMALLSAAEGKSQHDLRTAFLASAPRTATVFSELFRVDSIRLAHLPDQSTLVTYALTMTPDGIQRRYPSFARYLRRYAQSARMRWRLTNRDSVSFVDCWASEGHLALRVRTLDGHLIPTAGLPAALPDSLLLHGEIFTMKVGHFTVGIRQYHANFTIERDAHERAWSIVSRHEPQWVLPLFTEHLLRTPLRRPFQGRGALFRIGVRDSSGAQTLLTRKLHLEVQESLILRFIGRLGAIAVGDYAGKVEREENEWFRELFEAVVADISALDAP